MNKEHRSLDIELQRQRYGENSELLKGLGYNTDVKNIKRMGKELATQDTWRYIQEQDLEDLEDLSVEQFPPGQLKDGNLNRCRRANPGVEFNKKTKIAKR